MRDKKRDLQVQLQVQPLHKKLKSPPNGEQCELGSTTNQPVPSDLHDYDEQAMQWLRQEHHIHVEGIDVSRIMVSFDELPLWSEYVQVLHRKSIRQPTAIQMQMIPSVLAGRDVIALSETGSGKTLSYLLPLLSLLQQRPLCTTTSKRPFALIVVPTRELMEQIFTEICAFGLLPQHHQPHNQYTFLRCFDNFRVVGICGGVSFQQESAALHSIGVDIVVATPGRLVHHLTTANAKCCSTAQTASLLSELKYLVLDEVDRMLDVEMEPQIREILSNCNENGRQTMLLSATMPHFLDRLARSAVLNPVVIRVGVDGGVECSRQQMPDQIEQRVMFLRHFEKKTKLLAMLRTIEAPPVIVFCNSHECVDFVARVLQREQFHVAPLHAGKSQKYRFQVMQSFRDGLVDVLVTTDLASRGIDVAQVTCVINYDMPATIEDYVHRCGRTGRTRHKRGLAISLLTSDCTIAIELKQLLQENEQQLPPELVNLRHFFPQLALSRPP